MNKIIVEVSIGELLDKISILEIKQEKIKDDDNKVIDAKVVDDVKKNNEIKKDNEKKDNEKKDNEIKKNNEIKKDNEKKDNEIKKDTTPKNPSGKVIPKPTKPLSDKSPAAKAGIPIEKRQKFANQNAAFQATKKKDSGYTKMDFIKDFPNSQTAKKYRKGEPIPGFKYKKNLKSSYEYDAYDLVLEYLLSTEQVATIEEANYVMTEMDGKTINDIVKEVTQSLEEGIGSVRILPALGKMALGAAAVKGAASYLGRKAGEKSIKKTEPKKPGLIKTIKDKTDATNKAIKEMP